MAATTTAASAPGKVLLAGGYLVLDPKYTGLVFGLSARIHVVVKDVEDAAAAGDAQTKTAASHNEIVVDSPQFKDAQWRYSYEASETGGVSVKQVQGTSPSSPNKFVETALSYALTYISTLTSDRALTPSTITILADNDYYSNTSPHTLPSYPAFTDFTVPLSSAHKTGLGSSAALVTAFTGAVLSHYLPSSSFSLTTTSGRARLHNLAQIAHCAAQGKVGSGFDVAAAVHGTCVYRRFSPSILSSLGEPTSPGFATRVQNLVDNTNTDPSTKWDTVISKGDVTIPSGMALVMCDVDCGSETVGMVKQVLAWRSASPSEADELWNDLQTANENLASLLTRGEDAKLESAFADIRAKIRQMGTASGVPIEPEAQTELLDAATAQVKGVKGGVVPGAGGYDAIVLLVQDDEVTKRELDAFLEKWSAEKGSKVKLLTAKGELEGARVEDVNSYSGGK